MKQITKAFFFLFVISSFSSVSAQTPVVRKSVVNITESFSTKNDSIGTHYITTIQKDSTFADSTYQTKTIKDKIMVCKGASKVTTEKTSTTLVKIKNY
jgi:hypothetical protein